MWCVKCVVSVCVCVSVSFGEHTRKPCPHLSGEIFQDHRISLNICETHTIRRNEAVNILILRGTKTACLGGSEDMLPEDILGGWVHCDATLE